MQKTELLIPFVAACFFEEHDVDVLVAELETCEVALLPASAVLNPFEAP